MESLLFTDHKIPLTYPSFFCAFAVGNHFTFQKGKLKVFFTPKYREKNKNPTITIVNCKANLKHFIMCICRK